jgi:hypothetical protein
MEKETKDLLIEVYKKFGENKGLLLRGKNSYTGNEVAEEIANETKVGMDIYKSIISLTCDLLSRQKLEIK